MMFGVIVCLTAVTLLPTIVSCTPVSGVDALTRRSLEKRIVGGEEVSRGEAKFSVSLWYKKPNFFTINTGLNHVCGGTLIARRWVLTSAHCFDDAVLEGLSVLSDWEVVLGENDQNITEEGEQKFTIDKIFVSPKYNLAATTGDVGLVYLSGAARLDHYVGTIDLDDDSRCAVAGAKCIAYGWGQTQEEPLGYGSIRQYKAEVTLWDNEQCAQAYSPLGFFSITEKELCAADAGRDACNGDLGGPLICNCDEGPVVSGVVFTGLGCARVEYPGIYERVSIFADWIETIMEENGDDDDNDGGVDDDDDNSVNDDGDDDNDVSEKDAD